jgi:hypothetical protein
LGHAVQDREARRLDRSQIKSVCVKTPDDFHLRKQRFATFD